MRLFLSLTVGLFLLFGNACFPASVVSASDVAPSGHCAHESTKQENDHPALPASGDHCSLMPTVGLPDQGDHTSTSVSPSCAVTPVAFIITNPESVALPLLSAGQPPPSDPLSAFVVLRE
ncbi:MAG: hypothetical protein V1926_01970 [Candidatus Peregrinibacteria bacterium]